MANLPFGWGEGIPQQSAADFNTANNRDPNDPNSGAVTDPQSYTQLAKTYLQLQATDEGRDELRARLAQDPVYQYLEKNGWLRWGEGAGGQGPVLGDTYHKAQQEFLAAHPGANFNSSAPASGAHYKDATGQGIDPVLGSWQEGGKWEAPKSSIWDFVPQALQIGAGVAAGAAGMPSMGLQAAGAGQKISNMFGGSDTNTDPRSSQGYAIKDEAPVFRASQAFPSESSQGGSLPQWIIDMMKQGK